MASENKFVTANGLRLHYIDHQGPAHAPWVVCIHGLTGNAHNFDALAPFLTPKFRVIAIDVRGRGESQWGPPTEYLPQNYASDFAAMLNAIGIPRASLIGTSMGGIISMMYAGGWPDRVERLVLNDVGPDIDPAGLARITGYVGEAPDTFKDIGAVAQYFRDTYPPMRNLPEEFVRQQVQWSVRPATGGTLRWKMDPNVRRPLRGATAQQRLDLWVPYTRITCPVLIIRGAESDILAAETASRMCKVHPQAKSIEVPGIGHAPFLTEPESIAAIKKFFAM